MASDRKGSGCAGEMHTLAVKAEGAPHGIFILYVGREI